MDIKIIVFDLDGTLLNSQNQLSDAENRILFQVQQRFSLVFVYATGRSPAMASLIKGLPAGYFVCNNGAQVYDKAANENGFFEISEQHLLQEKPLDPELSLKIIALARKHQLHLECNYATATVYERLDYEKIKLYKNPILELGVQQVNWDTFDKAHCFKFATMGKETELESFTRELAACSQKKLHWNYSYPGYLEIYADTLDKSSSVEQLLKAQQLKWSETMAFGDGGNDVQLLKKAAVGVVMQNSHSQLLKEDPQLYRALNNDEQGVGQFLRSWFRLK